MDEHVNNDSRHSPGQRSINISHLLPLCLHLFIFFNVHFSKLLIIRQDSSVVGSLSPGENGTSTIWVSVQAYLMSVHGYTCSWSPFPDGWMDGRLGGTLNNMPGCQHTSTRNKSFHLSSFLKGNTALWATLGPHNGSQDLPNHRALIIMCIALSIKI